MIPQVQNQKIKSHQPYDLNEELSGFPISERNVQEFCYFWKTYCKQNSRNTKRIRIFDAHQQVNLNKNMKLNFLSFVKKNKNKIIFDKPCALCNQSLI